MDGGFDRWRATLIRMALLPLAVMMPGIAMADADRGRELAATHCTRCHVVGDINPYGGIESTPSFIGMKRLADWERRYAEFYILPPHPALVRIEEVSAERDEERPAFVAEIILTLDDVESILAFVKTLPAPAP